ncbi:MAG: type VI secretion system baseplate subunit TssF [Holosporaceae bacterium]|jgi:type VI secretion system protein ImpG|nr:type VI secretion system baseplate subunit TssF [Holosporaceae bacterium]
MLKGDIDILADYYQNEISYLRSAGADFATKFPKIAKRLDISNSESSDPHVERMMESFAFLCGKLQRQIDDQFPIIASTLLDVLYQPLILPTPSCVMANFDIDLVRAEKDAGCTITKGTPLYSTSYSGDICTFMTAHALSLWPIEITSASIVHKEHIGSNYTQEVNYLKIILKYYGSPPEQMPKKLRFYIKGDAILRGKLFASIFSTDANVIHQRDHNSTSLPVISPIGLENDESLFPYPNTVHSGFRLLHEYFFFSDKFYGFDVQLSESCDISGETYLFIPMSYDIGVPVFAKNFSLFSVPIVNLFRKISEPQRLDYKQMEYCLIPDYRRYQTHEIYSIEKIVAVDANSNDEIYVPEFFACGHQSMFEKHNFYWKSRRKKSKVKDAFGEDVYISFIDTNFDPQFPMDKVFYAHTLCTNRGVAEQIPANGSLQMELSVPASSIYCTNHPTAQRQSIQSGEIMWKLISALSLDSISFKSHGLSKLKNILGVFADISNSELSTEIDAILSIESTIKTKRINQQTWLGFVPGTDVEITFDASIQNLGLPLSLIISKFLASYTSINTFTEVTVKNVAYNRILKKWNHYLGIRNYL